MECRRKNEIGGRAHHWDKNDITLFDIFSKDDTSVRSKRAGRSAFTVTKFELFGVKLVNEHGIGCTYLFMFHVNFRVLLFSYLRCRCCCCCYCCICCHGIYYYYYIFFSVAFRCSFSFRFRRDLFNSNGTVAVTVRQITRTNPTVDMYIRSIRTY